MPGRDLYTLKAFVKYDLQLQEKWTSPGGEVKLFTSCNYILKWHGKSKKKLSIVCDDHKQCLVEKLEKLATMITDKLNTNNELRQEENMAGESKKSHSLLACNADSYSQQTNNVSEYEAEKTFAEFCYNPNNSRTCYCKDFALQIKRIEDEIKLLQNRMDAHEIHDCTVPCNSDLSLRRGNVRLQSDLQSAKSTIKQLKTKVNELQGEKSSLTTVIRLLQEDNLQHANYSDRNNNAK